MNVVSGTLRSLNGHRHTLFSMAEEWRVSLVIGGGGSTVKGSRYRDLLRARLGDDVAVSAGKTHLFLYAGSAKAADEAGQVARAVLEEHGQFAEVRVERWDPSGTSTIWVKLPTLTATAPLPRRNLTGSARAWRIPHRMRGMRSIDKPALRRENRAAPLGRAGVSSAP